MKEIIKKLIPEISDWHWKNILSIHISGGWVVIKVGNRFPWLLRNAEGRIMDEEKYLMAKRFYKYGYITERDYKRFRHFVISTPTMFVMIVEKKY